MEIADGIHRIDTPLGERTNALYLLAGERLALFDTGVDGVIEPYVIAYMHAIGREAEEVRWVIVSHCDVDHFGGIADATAAFPNAVTCAHRADADLIEDFDVFLDRRARAFRADHDLDETPAGLEWLRSVTRAAPLQQRLVGGEQLRLGRDWTIDVLHVPGHSPGHLALWDPRSRSAVVSDAVLSDAVRTANGAPAFPPTYRFVMPYRATIAALGQLAPEWLLTAHYPTFRGDDGRGFLDSSAGYTWQLEAAVRTALAGRARTLREILPEVNAAVASWPTAGTEGALAYPVVGHLEDLWQRGELRRHDTDPTTWELADANR